MIEKLFFFLQKSFHTLEGSTMIVHSYNKISTLIPNNFV